MGAVETPGHGLYQSIKMYLKELGGWGVEGGTGFVWIWILHVTGCKAYYNNLSGSMDFR
jgi:hypothetical protein